jgi:hypothetical protein
MRLPKVPIRLALVPADGRADYLVVSDAGAVHAWQNNC